MRILGIETSCDETAASVVLNGKDVLSNVVVSSLKDHSKYGGVIPEIASRAQLESIQPVVDEALHKSKVSLKKIDGIAVTGYPGLIGSLLVGKSFAHALSVTTNIPLVEIDHIQAHLYANFLKFKDTPFKQPKLPAIGLVVSGGHTSLFYMKDVFNIKLIGQTLDDAAGEAFDKVSKILNLGYPGGPVIEKEAKKARTHKVAFTSAALSGTLNFSFSGTKTAVLYHYRDHHKDKSFSKANVADAFQKSVIGILSKKCLDALKKYKSNTLLIGGGVAANSLLRQTLKNMGEEHNINIHYPPMSACIDNAAMIAGLGYHHLRRSRG